MYTPERLNRWTMPDSYFGAQWPKYYSSGFGKNRDSDCLTRANFDAAIKAIRAASTPDESLEEDTVQVVTENHWACGWVSWIAIHESDTGALQCADELQESYEKYPVLDESLFSEYEEAESQEIWKNCYDWKERAAYIRENKSQFEFQSLADLIGCVRGNYFAGYAIELIA